MTMTTSTRTTYLTFTAAAVYVLAWVIGLLIAPTGPGIEATAAQVHDHYITHGSAVRAQALLVHGAAGLALGAMALGATQATLAPRLLRVAAVASGVGAALLSLVQAAAAVVATGAAAEASATRGLAFFHTINDLDIAKLVLLAVFTATTTAAHRASGSAARWWRLVTVLLVPSLLAGAGAFLVPHAVLNTLLAASLVLLLVWAIGLAWATRPGHAAAAPRVGSALGQN